MSSKSSRSAPLPRPPDGPDHVGAHFDLFAVHVVLVQVVGGHGLEGPGADVQRHLRGLDPPLTKSLEQRLG